MSAIIEALDGGSPCHIQVKFNKRLCHMSLLPIFTRPIMFCVKFEKWLSHISMQLLLYTDARMSMGYCLDIAFWYSSEYGTDLTHNLAPFGIFWERAVSINTHQLWRQLPADVVRYTGQEQAPKAFRQ